MVPEIFSPVIRNDDDRTGAAAEKLTEVYHSRRYYCCSNAVNVVVVVAVFLLAFAKELPVVALVASFRSLIPDVSEDTDSDVVFFVYC